MLLIKVTGDPAAIVNNAEVRCAGASLHASLLTLDHLVRFWSVHLADEGKNRVSEARKERTRTRYGCDGSSKCTVAEICPDLDRLKITRLPLKEKVGRFSN